MMPPATEKGIPSSAISAVAQRVEQAVEQHQDENQGDWNDQRKSFLRLLHSLELSGPLDAIADRERHVLGDPLLRLGNRAGEVAAAHAELDRHEPLIALVIDVRGAGVQGDGGELAQGNIGIAASGSDSRP